MELLGYVSSDDGASSPSEAPSEGGRVRRGGDIEVDRTSASSGGDAGHGIGGGGGGGGAYGSGSGSGSGDVPVLIPVPAAFVVNVPHQHLLKRKAPSSPRVAAAYLHPAKSRIHHVSTRANAADDGASARACATAVSAPPPRLLQFPPVEGAYPSFVYLGVRMPGSLLDRLDSVVQHARVGTNSHGGGVGSAATNSGGDGDGQRSATGARAQLQFLFGEHARTDEQTAQRRSMQHPHVSVSRVFPLPRFQRTALRTALQRAVPRPTDAASRVDQLCFDCAYAVLNDTRSRVFLVLGASSSSSARVLAVIAAVDGVLGEFDLPRFYVPPFVHMSVACVDVHTLTGGQHTTLASVNEPFAVGGAGGTTSVGELFGTPSRPRALHDCDGVVHVTTGGLECRIGSVSHAVW